MYVIYRLGLSLAVACALSAGLAGSADASCIAPVVADLVQRADVIAYGRITATGFTGSPLTFRPSTLYKGKVEGGAVTVQAGPSSGAGATSVDYRAAGGSDHTLYLRRSGDLIATDACSGSHPGYPTAQELAVFGHGAPAEGGSDALADLLDQPWVTPAIAVGVLGLASLLFVVTRRRRVTVAR